MSYKFSRFITFHLSPITYFGEHGLAFFLLVEIPHAFRGDVFDEIADAARIAPFVVVPREYLDTGAVDNLCILSIYDR